ncbi:MAG: hypothetical protein ACOYJB_07850 [Christensenellaceae bacterium]|jgi:hypothetical protein
MKVYSLPGGSMTVSPVVDSTYGPGLNIATERTYENNQYVSANVSIYTDPDHPLTQIGMGILLFIPAIVYGVLSGGAPLPGFA